MARKTTNVRRVATRGHSVGGVAAAGKNPLSSSSASKSTGSRYCSSLGRIGGLLDDDMTSDGVRRRRLWDRHRNQCPPGERQHDAQWVGRRLVLVLRRRRGTRHRSRPGRRRRGTRASTYASTMGRGHLPPLPRLSVDVSGRIGARARSSGSARVAVVKRAPPVTGHPMVARPSGHVAPPPRPIPSRCRHRASCLYARQRRRRWGGRQRVCVCVPHRSLAQRNAVTSSMHRSRLHPACRSARETDTHTDREAPTRFPRVVLMGIPLPLDAKLDGPFALRVLPQPTGSDAGGAATTDAPPDLGRVLQHTPPDNGLHLVVVAVVDGRRRPAWTKVHTHTQGAAQRSMAANTDRRLLLLVPAASYRPTTATTRRCVVVARADGTPLARIPPRPPRHDDVLVRITARSNTTRRAG